MKRQADLSLIDGTITKNVENLISRMSNMSDKEIRIEFISILDNENTSVSKETSNKWKLTMNTKKGKTQIMQMITNLYLAGSQLSINKLNNNSPA